MRRAERMRTSTGISVACADRAHRLFLDHAQQLHLHVQRQIGDLVEEQRAAFGGLERGRPCPAPAPVKLPFLWPKNSLSISSDGIAPQLTGTNGPLARAALSRGSAARRAPCRCPIRRRCAPAPGCARPCAIVARSSLHRRRVADQARPVAVPLAAPPLLAPRAESARSTSLRSTSRSTGLETKSNAPSLQRAHRASRRCRAR